MSLSARTEDRIFAAVTLSPSLFLLALLVGVPAATVIVMCFERVGFGMENAGFVGLANFRWVLQEPAFYTALWNTFVWVFGSVALEMLVGTGLALLLNNRLPMRPILRAIILAPYMIPTVVAALTWLYMFHDIVGIVNYVLIELHLISGPIQWMRSTSTAMLSVIIVGVWKYFPFVVLAILGILQAIPQEQYEAAKIDGASSFQQFTRITLPYILPVFLLTALLRTIWAVHKFDIIYLLTGGGPLDATTTIPVLVYFKGFVDFEFGKAAALALVTVGLMLLVMLAYLFVMKRVEDSQ